MNVLSGGVLLVFSNSLKKWRFLSVLLILRVLMFRLMRLMWRLSWMLRSMRVGLLRRVVSD